jgi:hypothetical protein
MAYHFDHGLTWQFAFTPNVCEQQKPFSKQPSKVQAIQNDRGAKQDAQEAGRLLLG